MVLTANCLTELNKMYNAAVLDEIVRNTTQRLCLDKILTGYNIAAGLESKKNITAAKKR